MQAVDWREAAGSPVQIHVLVIFDGYDKVAPSMWTRCAVRASPCVRRLSPDLRTLPPIFSIGRAYGGVSGDDVKRRVNDVFDQGAQFCALQWGSEPARNSSLGFGGAAGLGAPLASRDLCLAPLEIDCRSAMLSDAREQSDLSPISTFPVELRAWLGREGSPEVRVVSCARGLSSVSIRLCVCCYRPAAAAAAGADSQLGGDAGPLPQAAPRHVDRQEAKREEVSFAPPVL